MNITVNGQPVYIDPEMIGTILPIVLPIFIMITVFMIVGFSIRSAVKNVTKQIPKGTLRQINEIRKQIPKGMNWQQLVAQWDIKKDNETGKVTIKKKSTAGESSLSPSEMQVTSLAQLPGAMRQLLREIEQNSPKNTRSASAPKPAKVHQESDPFIIEGAGIIGKVVLGILLLGILYGIGFFLKIA